MTRIGLMMIVKNEAHVIERCLDSVRRLVDWWVIVDTGSSDGTQDLVRAAMDGIPGELCERPWVNFGHNRQEALELARGWSSTGAGRYVLTIDADEQLVGVPAEQPALELDGYDLTVSYGGVRYSRLAIVDVERPWRWVGPVHEYLDLPDATRGHLEAPTVLVTHDGARSCDPETYAKDTELLGQALLEDPGNPRLQFYLAQSLRDAGRPSSALRAYRDRADNTAGWDQERWCALYRSAQLLEQLDARPSEIVDAYLEAYQACSWRAEPLVDLARVERGRDRFEVAVLYARRATEIQTPGPEALFVDVDTYAWRAWDELAIASYWTGDYEAGAMAAAIALEACPTAPRLKANLAFCRDALAWA